MTLPHLTKPNAIVLIHPAKHRRPEHLGYSPRAIILATADYQPDESAALNKVVETLEAAITKLAPRLPVRFAFCDTDYRLKKFDVRNIGLQKMFRDSKRSGQWATIAHCGNGRSILRSVSELACVHWEPSGENLAVQLDELVAIIGGFEDVIRNAETIKT